MNDLTRAPQLAALAKATRAELDALLPRMRDNVIWSIGAIRLTEWLLSKAAVRQDTESVLVIVPAGRVNDRLGYLLYACLERAANTVNLVEDVEGYSQGGVHGLKLL